VRSKLTFANVVALMALFFALGGPSFAADALDSAVKRITGKQVKNNSLTTTDVKNGSLLRKDFKKGQLPAGVGGPELLSNLISVDGKGSSLDADLLDGLDAASLQRRGSTTDCTDGNVVTGIAASGDVSCAPDASGHAPAVNTLWISAVEATTSAAGKTLHANFDIYDTDNLHAEGASSEFLVAPVDGMYVVSATVDWEPNSTGYRRSTITGPSGPVASVAGPPLPAPAFTSQNPSGIERLAAGQSVKVEVLQGSGGNLGVRLSRFQMTYVGRF
jgi:hypothetical protein